MDDLENINDPLGFLRKLGKAFSSSNEFLDRLQDYQGAGWPFGQETDAFLLWVAFGMETTVN